jgi:spoIIIJ-associated protein
MIRSIEAKGKTIDDAIANGLAQLGLEREKVTVTVLDEGNRGILGILGSRDARVRLAVRINKAERGIEILSKILEYMNVDSPVVTSVSMGDYVALNVSGENLGLIIGKRGQTLDAIQYIVNLILNRELSDADEERVRVVIDVEGYRNRRQEALRKLANRLAERALIENKSFVLEPMTPYERRIIHMALGDNPQVSTFSQGAEPYRKVVISPKHS